MTIQTDTKKMLEETGWTQNQLAKAAGVHFVSLSRFLSRDGRSVAERIWPFVYGDKRPSASSGKRPLRPPLSSLSDVPAPSVPVAPVDGEPPQ